MSDAHPTPLISVIMSVYNGERYLATAVDSTLAQTFTDFELIVINDGSTDCTQAILDGYTDSRLRIIRQENMGLTRSLNRGIRTAQGELIARMDADDISMPLRFERQAKFLQEHPRCVLLGTAWRQLDQMRAREIDHVLPRDDAVLRRLLATGNPFCHSSVMMRRSALEQVGYYDETFRYSQDYELWSRLAQVGELHNLPDLLVHRRYHAESVSNNPSTELYRMRLFWRAGTLAIDRLGLPYLLRLPLLRIICMTLASDIVRAGRQGFKRRLLRP